MAAVRPYRFAHLPRLTKAQVALQASFGQFISERPLAPAFLPELEKLLGGLLRGGCRIVKSEMRSVRGTELVTQSTQLGCYVILAAAPSEHRIVVDIDARLAALFIDRILGGSGETLRMPRPWTDVEVGLLSYVLLQVLAFVQDGMHDGHELALVLERVVGTLAAEHDALAQADNYFQLGYRLDLGGRIGYGRVLLPHALVRERFCTAPTPHEPPQAQELARMRRHLRVLDDMRITVHVVAATLELGQADVDNVEVGDIIVLEEHRLHKTTDSFSGDVDLRLGLGRHARVRCRLHSDAEHARLEIIDIASHAELQEEDVAPTDPHDAEDTTGEADGAGSTDAPEDDNLGETQGLLRDVPTSVAIELGRLRLSAAQLVRLRRGQTLRLPRGPNDPVDLVVNGRLFAKGELIEVDGELGVRLTQLLAGG